MGYCIMISSDRGVVGARVPMGLRLGLICGLVVIATIIFGASSATALSGSERCVKHKLKAAGRHARDIARCYGSWASSSEHSELAACALEATSRAADHLDKTTTLVESTGAICPAGTDDLLLSGSEAWFPSYVLLDLFPPQNSLPSQCVRHKVNGIGKYADKLSKCLAKDYLKPDAAKLATCEDKSASKLTKSFLKASKAGPCNGEAAFTTAGVVGARVRDQVDILRFGRSFIETPSTAFFTNSPTVNVTGGMRGTEPIVDLHVNGVTVLPLDATNSYSTVASIDPVAVFNPIIAEASTLSGDLRRSRVTVVAGNGVTSGFVADGATSPKSVAMHLTDYGLDQVAPLVTDLAADAFDIEALILAQNPIMEDECVAEFLGLCLYWATVYVNTVDFSALTFDLDAEGAGQTAVNADISDFAIDLDLTVSDALLLSIDCGLDIDADVAEIDGIYDMTPLAGSPSKVDVDQIGDVDVALGGFSHNFTSGVCDWPVIGDIIDLFIGGTLSTLVSDSFTSNLVDPDGSGPLDSPIADGIEGALDGIDIAGPVGQAIGVDMQTAFDSIDEDNDGITFSVDSAIVALIPAPGAPDLTASYTVTQSFPAYTTTTPLGGLPYGLALGLSADAFNQLMKAEVESGLLSVDITEFDLTGGNGQPLRLTIAVLASFMPELLDVFPGFEPVLIEVRPTLAPTFTGSPGPAGEIAEILISHMIVDVRLARTGVLVLGLAIDAAAGLDLLIESGSIDFDFGAPDPADVAVTVLNNPADVDEMVVEDFIVAILPIAFPDLAGALGGLPLPTFLGLQLDPIEVSKQGDFLSIFANLTTP
jgi:hypothetical protein